MKNTNSNNEDSPKRINYDLFRQQVDLLKSKFRAIDPKFTFPYGPRSYNEKVQQWNQSFIPSIWKNNYSFNNGVGYTYKCFRDKNTFLFMINYHIYLESFSEEKYRESFKKEIYDEISKRKINLYEFLHQNLKSPYMLIMVEFPLDENSYMKAFDYYSKLTPLNLLIAEKIDKYCKNNWFKR